MTVNNSRSTRRTIIKATGGSVAALGIAGCLGDDDEDTNGDDGDRPAVQVSGGGGGYGESRIQNFWEPFENGEGPYGDGHSYEYTEMASDQYMADIQQNPENPDFDTVELDDQRAPILGEAGALVNHAEEIDNWENIPDAFKTEWMGASTVFPRGIAYRADEIDKEISSWDDLIDPDLEGQVGFEPWENAGSKYFYVINHIEGGDVNNIEPGLEWMEEFVETTDPIIFDQVDQADSMFENDEILITPYLSARSDSLRLDSGLDMEFVIPEEGSVMDYWGYPILRHRPEENIEEAKAALEGHYTPEIQAGFAEDFGYPPAMQEAYEYISDEALEERFLELTEEQTERFDVDIDWVEAQRLSDEHGPQFQQVIAS
ncbi:ABC transporter substrate-binding protein [Halorubrum vacuolatum]|uniref:Spermidine/putrescine-binding protein n=1 Tax=Halorubrum vacuolatum TaxID=63740 RepID=A0A238Y850_HALVU|nr:extracellular solute-binding protein [Halorubrum vacuolatum]SNR66823.1 Spermidine/putrescine-binding protein [Halorubrum vacuolatum]